MLARDDCMPDQPSLDTTQAPQLDPVVFEFDEHEHVATRGHHYRWTRFTFDFAGRSFVICEHVHDARADVQAVELDHYRAAVPTSRETWEKALASCMLLQRKAVYLDEAKRLGFPIEVMTANGLADAWVTSVEDWLLETTAGPFRRSDGYSTQGQLAYVTTASLQSLEAELRGASCHRFVNHPASAADV